jgi:probable biosynthetic protein (TIGR04098 family)
MNTEHSILSILREEIPDLTDYSTSLSDLPIDSFGLVVLRGRIEEALGRAISDDVWSKIVSVNDVLSLGTIANAPTSFQQAADGSVNETRSFSINMPQMAISGLSESWLLKELGDLHWNMITRGLGASSSSLKDGNGNRLYATFTRIAVSTKQPLSHFLENEKLSLRGAISRHGAGTFISGVEFDDELNKLGSAMLMSNFSRRNDASNTSLLKGQPEIPLTCPIPETGVSSFAQEYRSRRHQVVPDAKFECEYEIVPFHDVNGVGLLYFAAYPIISDVCTMKYQADFATSYSTTSRDIYYFSNTDIDDRLTFRVHNWQQTGKSLRTETSISRKSDGLIMAYILTTKSHG